MKAYVVATLFAVLSSGCVKIELGNVVSDTVDASKELYETIKRKSNGEEERKYSHSVPSSDEKLDLENIAKCNNQIKHLIADSGFKISEVLSESSQISLANDERSVQCALVVVGKKHNA